MSISLVHCIDTILVHAFSQVLNRTFSQLTTLLRPFQNRAEMGLDVEAEVKQLKEEIKRLGGKGPDDKTSVRIRSISRSNSVAHEPRRVPRVLTPTPIRFSNARRLNSVCSSPTIAVRTSLRLS